MSNIFFEITIIICLVALFSIIFKLLRQPLILAYILTGIIIGPFGQLQLGSREILQMMSELGVTFLLFMLGLELRIGELKSIGKVASTIGVAQIVFTTIFGSFVSLMLGFPLVTSIYIGLVLAFSSTIIVVKLLSDKKDLNSLYGKITIGILLVQDLFAILLLIIFSSFSNNVASAGFSLIDPVFALIKGFVLFGFVLLLSKTILPKIVGAIARSQEVLFLVSIAWLFGLTALVSSPLIGFPTEIGGLLAGLALANSIANYQIVARVRSLRDFFITIFFVSLGLSTNFSNFNHIIYPAIWLSLFVLIIKPLTIILIMGITGYRKRTSFLTGITLAQISEFSLIFIFLTNRLGQVQNEVVSIIMLVGIISFVFSNYMIFYGNKLYRILNPYLKYFERKSANKELIDGTDELKNHVVLIGVHRIGKSILEALKEEKEQIVTIDFNPDVVSELKKSKVSSFFGDVTDLEIMERARLDDAKLVISTVPDIEDNLRLIDELNNHNRRAKIIVLANYDDDAKVLYKAGADYVILPHLIGGKHIAKILRENNLDKIKDFKEKDLGYFD
ncbi:cation:proton antiporter, partial [Patescibacteria group bacterium]|nr:cation:proton antiporter [Patescibacteria group bacterium]MCL5432681.1 cation:proton antiporter [Patescibacteria group bacterium]